MEITTLGEITAVRIIELHTEDGNSTVTIKIGKPVDVETGMSYCAFQILGIGNERIRSAIGVDSVQALILALTKIGTDLYMSPESRAGRLSWMGDPSGNLGMPVISEALADAVKNPMMSLTL
jgi:hypothetical protein